ALYHRVARRIAMDTDQQISIRLPEPLQAVAVPHILVARARHDHLTPRRLQGILQFQCHGQVQGFLHCTGHARSTAIATTMASIHGNGKAAQVKPLGLRFHTDNQSVTFITHLIAPKLLLLQPDEYAEKVFAYLLVPHVLDSHQSFLLSNPIAVRNGPVNINHDTRGVLLYHMGVWKSLCQPDPYEVVRAVCRYRPASRQRIGAEMGSLL